MALNEQQQRALQHAREVLTEAPPADHVTLMVEWYREVRRALNEIVIAFPAEYVEQPPPDAGDSDPGGAS